MFGFLNKKPKHETTPREALIIEIEHEYDVWLQHSGEMTREIKRIPELTAQQDIIEKLQTSGMPFLKENDNAEKLKEMDVYYTGRINECARAAIAEFKALTASWDRICEIRRKLDADKKGAEEGE